MPNYHRARTPGGTYFFTVVTFERQPILTSDNCRSYLWSAWLDVRRRFPFTTIAVCLLPDHIHCIWSLPEDDADYSIRWREIKRLFTRSYLLQIGSGREQNESREKRKEAAIWKRRFWEHLIRDEEDLQRHFDTIHCIQVKHGIVKTPQIGRGQVIIDI